MGGWGGHQKRGILHQYNTFLIKKVEKIFFWEGGSILPAYTCTTNNYEKLWKGVGNMHFYLAPCIHGLNYHSKILIYKKIKNKKFQSRPQTIIYIYMYNLNANEKKKNGPSPLSPNPIII